MADRRNLPSTLELYGHTEFTLDLTFEDEVGDDIDYADAPIRPFWTANSQRIRLQLHALKKKLLKAQKEKGTRAVLLYNGSTQVQVYADKGLLFEGEKGQDFINLTTQALGEFYNIISPILITLFIVPLVLRQFEKFTATIPVVKPRVINLPDLPRAHPSDNMVVWYVIITVVGVAAVLAYLRWFRAQFMAFVRWFMAIDIFLILTIGAVLILIVCFKNLNVSTDVFSVEIFAYNFGIVGLLPFYKPVGELGHRLSLVTLFVIMAIIFGIVIGQSTLLFVFLFALTEVYAMMRPRIARRFTPFILPRNFQVPNTTPRLFYEIHGLRLRATDFLFYGLIAVFTTNMNDALTVGYTGLLVGLILCLYVLPFFSTKIRPFPVAFTFFLISIFITDQILNPYLANAAEKWTLMHP